MCDRPKEDIIFSILNDTSGMIGYSDADLVREFREFANMFCPGLYLGAYYELNRWPPRISDELFEYSLKGIESLKV